MNVILYKNYLWMNILHELLFQLYIWNRTNLTVSCNGKWRSIIILLIRSYTNAIIFSNVKVIFIKVYNIFSILITLFFIWDCSNILSFMLVVAMKRSVIKKCVCNIYKMYFFKYIAKTHISKYDWVHITKTW